MLIRTQEVEVAEGKLRGRVVKSQITNDIYFSFLGIPYGKPPVGTLRFSVGKFINFFDVEQSSV